MEHDLPSEVDAFGGGELTISHIPVSGTSKASPFLPAPASDSAPSLSTAANTDEGHQVDWVQCDACEKWRILPKGSAPVGELDMWTCHLNTLDPEHNFCEAPEQPWADVNEPEGSAVLRQADVEGASADYDQPRAQTTNVKAASTVEVVVEEEEEEDEDLVIDGVSAAEDRVAEEADAAEEAALEALGGAPEDIDILWEGDFIFYTAKVLSFDAETGLHRCRYFDDGLESDENLKRVKWYRHLEDEEEEKKLLTRIRTDYNPKRAQLLSNHSAQEAATVTLPSLNKQGEDEAPSKSEQAEEKANTRVEDLREEETSKEDTGVEDASGGQITMVTTKTVRCGTCDGCANFTAGRSTDCGRCDACRDMPKFGGRNRGKQICEGRQCSNRMKQEVLHVVKQTPVNALDGPANRHKCSCSGCENYRAGPRIECGECEACRKLPKFGGTFKGTPRPLCELRRCIKVRQEEQKQREEREMARREREALRHAEDQLWVDVYIKQRDRWEADIRAQREGERSARADRMAKRAELRAAKRAAKRAAMEARRKRKQQSGGSGEAKGKKGAAAEGRRLDRKPKEEKVAESILESNGEPGHLERFLVRWAKMPRSAASWVAAHKLPRDLLVRFVDESRAAFNRKLEPLLTNEAAETGSGGGGGGGRSGVVGLRVPEEEAARCYAHLQQHWRDGKLPLRGGATAAYGYATYGKTLSEHDASQQAKHTLLLTNPLLPLVREEVPGFHSIELFLIQWLHSTFGIVVELYFAHGLRQSPLTLKSTGFDVHQDVEDFPFIEYTVVVKLTADVAGEPPSRMRVVGAPYHFEYGAPAGSAGAFLSRLFHASVEPAPDTSEHLKVAFFFRPSSKGERRAKRGLAAAGAALDHAELAERRTNVALEMSAAGQGRLAC